MGAAARGGATALLLVTLFLGHGLQCESTAVPGLPGGSAAAVGKTTPSAGSPAAHGHPIAAHHLAEAVAGAPRAAVDEAAPTATSDGRPGHRHGPSEHLSVVCLAVLAAGLAALSVLRPARPCRPARSTGSPTWLHAPSWPPPPRPPNLLSLCVLRI